MLHIDQFSSYLFIGLITAFSSNLQGQSHTQIGSDIDGEAIDDHSGSSVAISADGMTIAVGAPENDGVGPDAGHVRVYEFDGTSWVRIGLDINGEDDFDASGASVALSSNGTRVAIGAVHNDGASSDAGHVRVYDLAGGVWVQVGQDLDGDASNDLFGWAVSFSSTGDRLAVGGYSNDNSNGTNAGHVRVFEHNGSMWGQVGNDILGQYANDFSGYSISLSADGSRVAVGSPYHDLPSAPAAGHVRIFDLVGNAWVQAGVAMNGDSANDHFGESVSLSADGSRVAIGAPWNGGNGYQAGHVKIYEYDGVEWNQVGSDIEGEASGDWAGTSVYLAGGGDRVAVGSPRNGGTGPDAGQVRIFDLIGSTWTQVGMDIDGEASEDRFGGAIALSMDSNIVAMGGRFNDDNGTDAGHVRVYQLSPLSLSVEDPEPEMNWSVHPTVGNGILNMEFSGRAEGPYSFRVTNMTGKVVFSKQNMPLSGKGRLDLRHLSSGSYLLQVTSNRYVSEQFKVIIR